MTYLVKLDIPVVRYFFFIVSLAESLSFLSENEMAILAFLIGLVLFHGSKWTEKILLMNRLWT